MLNERIGEFFRSLTPESRNNKKLEKLKEEFINLFSTRKDELTKFDRVPNYFIDKKGNDGYKEIGYVVPTDENNFRVFLSIYFQDLVNFEHDGNDYSFDVSCGQFSNFRCLEHSKVLYSDSDAGTHPVNNLEKKVKILENVVKRIRP